MVDTQELIQELSRQASPVTASRPYSHSIRLLGILLVYAGLTQWGLGVRPDMSVQFTRPAFVIEILLLGILSVSAALACVLVMYPDAYQRPALIRLPYACAGVTAGFVLVQWFMPWDARMIRPDAASHTVECAIFIAMAAVLPAMLIFILLKKAGATLMPVHAGALAVIAAASIGALTLRLAEANDDIAHLLIWHYLPTTGFAIIGALLGRWLLKW